MSRKRKQKYSALRDIVTNKDGILLHILKCLVALLVGSLLAYIIQDWVGVQFFHDGSRVGYFAYCLDGKVPFGFWERIFRFFYVWYN